MQRTVKTTKVTLIARGCDDTIVREFRNETDDKKIIKSLEKEFSRGSFMIIEEDVVEDLYILDDEVFFKYAVKVDKNKTTQNGEG